MEGYIIRPTVYEELKQLKELYKKMPRNLKSKLQPNHQVFSVVTNSGKVIGTFILSFHKSDYDNGTIASVYIKPEYRRQGIFSSIIRYVELLYPGFTFAIGCHKRNKLAVTVYEKMFEKYDAVSKNIKWFWAIKGVKYNEIYKK